MPQNVTKDVTYEAVFEQQTAITIQAKDFSKQYDGQPLVVPEDNWNIEQPNPLPDGFKAIVTLKPVEDNIVHVGESGKNQIDSVTNSQQGKRRRYQAVCDHVGRWRSVYYTESGQGCHR